MTDGSISVDTGTDELLCAIRDRVAVITLNRPEARNSLSDHLTPALRRMIKQNGDDPEVGALLITGAGTAFCSGDDVKQIMGGGDGRPAEQLAAAPRLTPAAEALLNSSPHYLGVELCHEGEQILTMGDCPERSRTHEAELKVASAG